MTWLFPLAMAAEEVAGHEAAGGHEGVPMAAIVNFGILVAALVYFARKPLAQAFSSKHDAVKTAVEEAEMLRKQVEQMVTEYKRKLSSLDGEVAQILNEARDAGEKERKAILERAEKLAAKIKHDAVLAAEKERERMKQELEQETLNDAARKAAELLKGRVTDKEHKAFTNELIERLEQEANG